MDNFLTLLRRIYGDNDTSWKKHAAHWLPLWEQRCQQARKIRTSTPRVMTEQLVLLITYGDTISMQQDDQQNKEMPLQTLYRFMDEQCEHVINGVHILPYFPYTSDDGFSISDYSVVREDLGTWKDIEKLASEYHLMSDFVLNHCSSEHKWFKKFLAGEPPFHDYFITGDPKDNYEMIARPRAHFVLSEYETQNGKQHVWTTFSRDQVDLNFANPAVLFEMLDIMLTYVIEHKSRLIRLDAIAYLWKELGTPCIHHEKTHLIVKLMRSVLDHFVPDTIMITETNVPHKENISYFGDNDEAQMVYQFPLPPLLLHAMVTENAQYLSNWARSLPQPNEKISYFNFCASHDGIGITPTHGILSEEEQENLIAIVKSRGGMISYKATPRGEIPYELNINYLSAISPVDLPVPHRAKMFLVSQSIVLAMPGVPGIYIHSLLGSENWSEGVERTGSKRSINRQKLFYDDVIHELNTEGSLRNLVFHGYITLLRARSKSIAFHPASPAQVLSVGDELFALIRGSDELGEYVICVANLTSQEVSQPIDVPMLALQEGGEDILNGDMVFLAQNKQHAPELILDPYEILWLRFKPSSDTGNRPSVF